MVWTSERLYLGEVSHFIRKFIMLLLQLKIFDAQLTMLTLQLIMLICKTSTHNRLNGHFQITEWSPNLTDIQRNLWTRLEQYVNRLEALPDKEDKVILQHSSTSDLQCTSVTIILIILFLKISPYYNGLRHRCDGSLSAVCLLTGWWVHIITIHIHIPGLFNWPNFYSASA